MQQLQPAQPVPLLQRHCAKTLGGRLLALLELDGCPAPAHVKEHAISVRQLCTMQGFTTNTSRERHAYNSRQMSCS